jgi:hypothetical protein
MGRFVFPLGFGALLAWTMFADIWWLGAGAIVLLTLLASWLEHENDQLRALHDQLRDELAQHRGEPPPDHGRLSGPRPQAGDAFLDRLRRLE